MIYNSIMPNTRSAKKALRKSQKRYLANKRVKERIKRWTKKFLSLIEQAKVDAAEKTLFFLQKLLDKAGKRHIFHKNKVNRLKSRYYKRLYALKKSISGQAK